MTSHHHQRPVLTIIFVILTTEYLVVIDKCVYYVEDDFTFLFNERDVEFSLIHFNILSIRKKIETLQTYLRALKLSFDVIALTETWLKEKDDLNLYKLEEYHEPIL